MSKEKFSLIKAINSVANGKPLDERCQNVVDAGKAEMRKSGQSYNGQIVLPIEERAAIAATVTGEGIENVAEDKLGILEPLRANLVLAQAGAQFLTGLIGDVSIPVYSGSNVTWKGETSTAADGAGTMSEVSLTPKRLTAYVDVSKQFLLQDSNAADQMLMNDLVMAITNKLEATILGLTAGSTTQPAGIFNGVTADTAAITFSDIVTMETNLENNNVYGNIAYIVNPSAKATLKTTAKATGTAQFLMEDNEIDGLPVYSTSSVTSKGVLIGNFADYVIGQWGGIDLTVDPYSQAANGNVRLVVNAYFDAKPRRSASFGVKILA